MRDSTFWSLGLLLLLAGCISTQADVVDPAANDQVPSSVPFETIQFAEGGDPAFVYVSGSGFSQGVYVPEGARNATYEIIRGAETAAPDGLTIELADCGPIIVPAATGFAAMDSKVIGPLCENPPSGPQPFKYQARGGVQFRFILRAEIPVSAA